MVGQTISHYKLVAELGEGGMGVVYEGLDERLGRRVAIKMLPISSSKDHRSRVRFENEARAAAALHHPNICTIHEIGESAEGQLFIAMSLYSGQTLEDRIEEGPLSEEEAVRIASEVARGLSAAHREGIVHRDIKPGNIMLTEDSRVIILDFGLAKMEEVNVTQDGESVGTVTYMSPEQARGGALDARTDVWSLGVVLYEMLSGRQPFKGQYSQAVLYTILNEKQTPLTDLVNGLSPHLASLVADCMQKEASERPASMDEVWARLNPEQPRPAEAHVPLRKTAIFATSGALVLVLALLLIVPSLRTPLLKIMGIGGLPLEQHLVVLARDAAEQAESGDSADETALENGLVETLVSALQQVEAGRENFWIVPTSRVLTSNVTTASEARMTLGVNLAIELDLSSQEDGIHLDLDLRDTESGKSLRHRTLVHPREEMDLLRSGMISAVADLLDIEIDPGVNRSLNLSRSTRPGAAEFYTQGLGYLTRYAEGDNLDASVILFKRAIIADSSYALAHAGLCASYMRMWQRNEEPRFAIMAEQSCEIALEHQSDLNSVYVTLGQLHTLTGRYGTALGEFQLALSNEPSNAEALIGMASTYKALGRLEEAENAYKEAIALKPDYWYGYSMLGTFYFEQARYEDSIEQFLIVADLNPFNARGYSNIGAIYFYLDRRQEAIEMFKLSLEIKEDLAAWSNLATLYFYEGQYADAAIAFEKALSMNDDSSFQKWGYLATAYKYSGQPVKSNDANRKAINLALNALDINPRDPETIGSLANYYASLDMADSSRVYLDQVIALNPTEPEQLSGIGETYELLGDRKAAIYWTELALKNGFALAEIIDYPGFADLRADPDFKPILDFYQNRDSSEELKTTTN